MHLHPAVVQELERWPGPGGASRAGSSTRDGNEPWTWNARATGLATSGGILSIEIEHDLKTTDVRLRTDVLGDLRASDAPEP
ncbi:hypothetical protein [Methanopyrus sp.]